MAKAEIKTQVTNASSSEFINSVQDQQRREDSKIIDKLMQQVSGEKAKMWGPAIIGYGTMHLKYESGRELDMPKLAFSPRKQNLSLYVLEGGEEKYKDLLDKLGKHSTGKICLYIKKLSDVDQGVLKDIFRRCLRINE